MTRGKQTCKILKEIRRQIAEANGIEFVTQDCRYKGDCPGTCPKCEAEVRYLEQQLHARFIAGKAIALAGISAGMIFMSGCNTSKSEQTSETSKNEIIEAINQIDWLEEGEVELSGEVPDDIDQQESIETPQSDNTKPSKQTTGQNAVQTEDSEYEYWPELGDSIRLTKKNVTTGEVAIVEEPKDTIQSLTPK